VIRPQTGNFPVNTTGLGISLTSVACESSVYIVAVGLSEIYILNLVEMNDSLKSENNTVPSPGPMDPPGAENPNNSTSVLSWSELTEIPTEPIEVDYPYNNPNHSISPKSNLDIKVNISFRVLEELDQNRNTVVRSLQLSSGVKWKQIKQNDSRLFRSNHAINNTPITIEINCTHYLNSTIIPVVKTENEIFYQQIDSHSNKWSISVTHWPFREVTNILRLTVGLNLSEPIKEIKENISELVYKRFISTSHSYVQMVLPTFAIIDDSFQNLKNLYELDKDQNIQLYFPTYTQTIEYDPHYSIRSNPGTPFSIYSNDLFGILGIVFSSVALVGIVIGIVIVVKYVHLKKKEARWKGVSF